MTNEMTFKTNSLFDTVTYDKDSDSWCFLFADKIYASATGFWRLLKANKIMLVSFDNGQKFGLPKSIDLIAELTNQLTGKILTEIKIAEYTADLTFIISDDIRIEFYISSSGYETYDFSFQNKRYIGLGSGQIEIVETTEKPETYTTRKL